LASAKSGALVLAKALKKSLKGKEKFK
jgi:hypothetical protein